MKHQLFIRLQPGTQRVAWVKSGEADGSIVTDVRESDQLAEAAADAAGARVVVMVPAEDVLLTRVSVPAKKSRNLLRQAIPYLLEEQLVEDVEELHFALGELEGDEIAVAVVSSARMDAWLEQLRQAGIEPHVIIPETLALPLETDAWTVLTGQQGRLLLRTGQQAGMELDLANAGTLLKVALEEAGEARPATLAIYECGELSVNLTGLDIELTRAPVKGHILSLLVAGYLSTSPINLLQGAYSRRERIGQYWRPWKVPLALTAVLLLLAVINSLVDYQRLSSEKSRLWNQIVATYKKTFPEESNVPYPQRQMEEHLKQLQGGGGGAGALSFSELLAKAGQFFKAAPTLKIQRLSYKNGSLEVALTIADLQKLDQLKQQLAGKGALAVEIVSAAARGKQVEARLRITGGSA